MADGYLLMVGRLDMPAEVWTVFAEGNFVGFENGIDIIDFTDASEAGMGSDDPEDIFGSKNAAKLAAGLGYNRYTGKLKDLNLENVIYYSGDMDEQVGRLAEEEIEFLVSHGARVVIRSDTGHEDTVIWAEPIALTEMLLPTESRF